MPQINYVFNGDMGKDGATCFNTLSSNSRDIPKDQWDNERFGQVCGSADAYSEFIAAILKLCADTGRCEYRIEREVKKFRRKLNRTKNTMMRVSQ
jgi:hypothetical protein